MSRADGVTVFTLTTDPQSAWPPICQIFKGLCYSPMCCSVSQHLRRVQNMSQSVLGVSYNLWICVHVPLGEGLPSGNVQESYLWNYERMFSNNGGAAEGRSSQQCQCSCTVQVLVVHTVFSPPQALHIMVGLLNIGLGTILLLSGGGSWWQMDWTLFPYWFGGMVLILLLCLLQSSLEVHPPEPFWPDLWCSRTRRDLCSMAPFIQHI